MRTYILTDQERRIIKKHLETGEKLEGYKVLLHRAKKTQTIKDDLTLIAKFLEKARPHN
jgi:hypothetical protein